MYFKSGATVSVRLDQGFAYWRFAGEYRRKFPFNENIALQAAAVANLTGAIGAPDHVPTQVFIKIVLHS